MDEAVALQCFLCHETGSPQSGDTLLYHVCKCNVLVHEECLTHMIQRVPSHRTRCAVCLTPYEYQVPGEEVVWYRRWKVACTSVPDAALVAFLGFSSFSGMCLIIYVSNMRDVLPRWISSLCIASSALYVALSALTVCYLAQVHYRTHRRVLCCRLVEETTDAHPRELKLPAPVARLSAVICSEEGSCLRA